MSAETEKKALAELLHAEEDRRTSFVHRLSWHEETAEAVLAELKRRGWTPPPETADEFEAEADRILFGQPLSDLNRAQRVGTIEQADAYLSTHRKSEVWSLINRLRDELVRA